MLEAAAHELGHVFGLNHVSELEHGALTMAPKIMSCQSSEVTLGLGDVKGLKLCTERRSWTYYLIGGRNRRARPTTPSDFRS
jgi:hypothetical protein